MINFEENCFPIIKENFLKEFGFKVEIVKNKNYNVGDKESLDKILEELNTPYFIIIEPQNYKDTSFWAMTNYHEPTNEVSLLAFNKGVEVDEKLILSNLDQVEKESVEMIDNLEEDEEDQEDDFLERYKSFTNNISIFYISQLTFLTSWVKSTLSLQHTTSNQIYKLNRPTLILKYIKDNLDIKYDYNIELKVTISTNTKYIQVSHKVYGELRYLIIYINNPKERICLDMSKNNLDGNNELYFEFGEGCTINNIHSISESTKAELNAIIIDIEEDLLEEIRQHTYRLKSIKKAKFLGSLKRFFSIKQHRK